MTLQQAHDILSDPLNFSEEMIGAAIFYVLRDMDATQEDWHRARALADDDN